MNRVVVGVDGSEHSFTALRWALDEARRRQWPVTAVLAWAFPHMVPVLGHSSDPQWLQGQAEETLEGWLKPALGTFPDIEVLHVVREKAPAELLLDVSHDGGLLVLGSRGLGGFGRLLLGSVSQQCAHHVRGPVVIVREDGDGTGPASEPRTPRIVVGVDRSGTARSALSWAVDEARLRSAALDVVHAWQPPYRGGYPVNFVEVPLDQLERSARQLLDGIVDRVDTRGVLKVERLLVCDTASRALLDTAMNADLVVVGSRGHGGFAGLLLGSVSQKVVHHAPCSVAIIPTREA